MAKLITFLSTHGVKAHHARKSARSPRPAALRHPWSLPSNPEDGVTPKTKPLCYDVAGPIDAVHRESPFGPI
jgi:hypothetical protein